MEAAYTLPRIGSAYDTDTPSEMSHAQTLKANNGASNGSGISVFWNTSRHHSFFFFFSFFSSIGNFISSSKTRKTIAAHAAKRDPLTLQLTESSAGADFNDGTTVSLT